MNADSTPTGRPDLPPVAPSTPEPLPQRTADNLLVIGLVGGVASGKSVVARRLAARGALHLDADAFAHQALQDPAVLALLRARWGEQIFQPTGLLNRRALGEIVFTAAEDRPTQERAARELRYLESLIHPRVRAGLEAALADAGKQGRGVVVLDVPLLLEVGWHHVCDLVLLVDTPREQRLRQAMSRGWSAAVFAAREKNQLDVAEKSRSATDRIDNRGSLADLEQEVDQFWERRVAGWLAAAE